MRIALIPMRLARGDKQGGLRAMGKWVDALHASADLLVFPQIGAPPGGAPNAGVMAEDWLSTADHLFDVMAAFAVKRGVHIAAGACEARSSPQSRSLALADRTGQLTVRRFSLAGSGAELQPETVGVEIAARVEGVPVALAAGHPLAGPALLEGAREAGVRAICILMQLTGSESEIRRVAVHNPPAALAGLKEAMCRLAVDADCHVLAVNGISDDTDAACGLCGGAFHYDPRGRLVAERRLYEEEPLEFDVA